MHSAWVTSSPRQLSDTSEYVVNPYQAIIRLSPTELILSRGVFSKSYISLSFDAIEKCDGVQHVLEKHMAEPAPLEAIRGELAAAGCAEQEIESLLAACRRGISDTTFFPQAGSVFVKI